MENNFQATADQKETITATLLLTVLIVLLSFTPVGYLNTNYISITFLPVLVVVGATQYGPICGGILGLAFGATSLVHCLADSYAFGQELVSFSLTRTVIVCIVPRILMGVASGCIHRLFTANCSRCFSDFMASFGGGFLNTVFFTAFLVILFYRSDYIQSLGDSVTVIVRSMISRNALIEWVVCTAIGVTFSGIATRVRRHNYCKKGIPNQ